MRKNRIIQAVLAGLLSALFCAGCAADTVGSAAPSQTTTQVLQAESTEPVLQSGFPVTVTDLSGNEVTIEAADRIVSLTPSSTSILIEEGVQDRIVGVDDSSHGAESAELCGDYSSPDVEKVLALEPDVVFAGNAIQQAAADQMREAGLAVVQAEALSFDQVPESFSLIGKAVGEEDAGAALVSQLEATISEVEAQKPEKAPSCYYVMSFGDAGNWTSGPGSFVNAMIEIAGGTCITSGGAAPWLDYPIEDLAAADPGCLILSSEAGSYEDLVTTPGYEDLSAVRGGLVFEIDADIVSSPGPSLSEGLLSLSSIINEAAQGPVPTAEAGATPEAVD